MISLMRPAPTLFLAASFTLYQVPHLRLSSLKERSEELMNTSFHSSLLSTEYWSTKPVGARRGSPLGTGVRERVYGWHKACAQIQHSLAVPGHPSHTNSCTTLRSQAMMESTCSAHHTEPGRSVGTPRTS